MPHTKEKPHHSDPFDNLVDIRVKRVKVRSYYAAIVLRGTLLHRNCGVTALQCRTEDKFMLT